LFRITQPIFMAISRAVMPAMLKSSAFARSPNAASMRRASIDYLPLDEILATLTPPCIARGLLEHGMP
jgi:hypothetical protein